MYMDEYGTPMVVTPENVKNYSYSVYGTMLMTSAEKEIYIPPKWHGTIYSTAEILNTYLERFKPNEELLIMHPMEPFEPEFICCERVVVELTVLPGGWNINNTSKVAVFLSKHEDVNTLITKELGTNMDFFPKDHHYHVRIMKEGIDMIYIDDTIYNHNTDISYYSNNYNHKRLHFLLTMLRPRGIKAFSGKPLPKFLELLCSKKDAKPDGADASDKDADAAMAQPK